jgi:Uma2 family endonuclease
MTTLFDTEKRQFTPGTPGWSADDLLDPKVERLWEKGAYEIVEGVLTIVPPAKFDASSALFKLCTIVTRFMDAHGLKGRFAGETDYVITRERVARVDAILLMEADFPKHRRTSESADRSKRKRGIGRLTLPPTLVVELISRRHERHDRVVKRRWYEDAGVSHFWILDERKRTLECFRHDGQKYLSDAEGKNNDVVRPSLFDGLSIPLRELWI